MFDEIMEFCGNQCLNVNAGDAILMVVQSWGVFLLGLVGFYVINQIYQASNLRTYDAHLSEYFTNISYRSYVF